MKVFDLSNRSNMFTFGVEASTAFLAIGFLTINIT
jgi:hypothetical protein